ncbi:MAG: hypothetical protein IIA17_08390 [candidate division Zixibacteria bacterium]|nr:hypothetical protein [candidate division Zixibacteria bacterium]
MGKMSLTISIVFTFSFLAICPAANGDSTDNQLAIEPLQLPSDRMPTLAELKTYSMALASSQKSKTSARSGNSIELLEFASSTIWSGTLDIIAVDSFLFVLNIHGLQIFNTSQVLRLVKSVPIFIGAFYDQLELNDSILYVGRREEVHVFDVSNPLSPIALDTISLPFTGMAMELKGNRLYVGSIMLIFSLNGEPVVSIYDVSEPSAVTLVGTCYIPVNNYGDAIDLDVTDSLIYITCNSNGSLAIYSIADEQNPVLLSLTYPGSTPWCQALKDTILFLGAEQGIVCYNVSNPNSPVYVATIPLGGTWSIEMYGDTLFARRYDSIYSYDVSDLSNVQELGVLANRGAWFTEFISGDTMYLPEYTWGFEIVDISDAANMIVIDTFTSPTWEMRGVTPVGDWVYCTKYNSPFNFVNALHVVDATDRYNPVHVTSVPAGQNSVSVAVDGSRLAVAAGNKLYLYDRTEAYNPQFRSLFERGSKIRIRDNYLYSAGYAYGLAIYDISDLYNPVLVSHPDYNVFLNGLTIDGDYAYTAEIQMYGPLDVDHFLRVTDISDPTNQVSVSNYFFGNSSLGLYVDMVKSGGFLYTATPIMGVLVFNVGNVNQPQLINQFTGTQGESVSGLEFDGRFLYLSFWDVTGIEVFDMIDPLNPVSVQQIELPLPSHQLKVQDGFLYVAIRSALYILKINPPAVACGDVNFDDNVNTIVDLTYYVDYIFRGGPKPYSESAANLDGDCTYGCNNIFDLIYLVDFIFRGGPVPTCGN